MNSDNKRKLKDKDRELVPIDKDTAQRIKRISSAMDDTNSLSIIHAAIQLLEKSLGRDVTFHKKGTNYNVTLNTYSRYPEITDL